MPKRDVKEHIVAREGRKAGLRGKINAFCCHCIYDPKDEGNWRQQITRCTSLHCPLYEVRPRSTKNEKIRTIEVTLDN